VPPPPAPRSSAAHAGAERYHGLVPRRLQPHGSVGAVNCGTSVDGIVAFATALLSCFETMDGELAEAALLQLAKVSARGNGYAALKQIVNLLQALIGHSPCRLALTSACPPSP
jgi:hypothetical protein